MAKVDDDSNEYDDDDEDFDGDDDDYDSDVEPQKWKNLEKLT